MSTAPSMRSLVRPLLAAAVALAAAACNSTGLAESWVAPGMTELPRFQKVFVAFLGSDETAERKAEDAMAARSRSAAVVKCYELFPDGGGRIDPTKVKEELRAAGCDGAVVMKLTRVEQEVSYTTGAYPSYYHTFGGYWGYPSTMDVRTDDILHVETNVYSLAKDELLYSARSETFNPASTTALVDEIAETIMEDLQEKGLVR